MDLDSIGMAGIAVLIVLVVIRLLGSYLSDVFVKDAKTRDDELFQGGETISSKILKYRAENFELTLFFLILHVIGFMGATLYVLVNMNRSPLNVITLCFGGLLFYIIFLLRNSKHSGGLA